MRFSKNNQISNMQNKITFLKTLIIESDTFLFGILLLIK